MINQRNPYRVFISSTFIDNEQRRKIVEDAIIQADMVPVAMERFTASHLPTVEKCEELARDCDVLVGIIAHRYGWIPDGQAISITELEYDAAKEAGRDRLMFELDDSVPVDTRTDFDDGPDRWVKQEKLSAFRAQFRADQMPTPFKQEYLGAKVLRALQEWRDSIEGVTVAAKRADPATEQLVSDIDRYRAAAESLHASLPLAGFKTKLRVPIDLAELYVPLHAMVDLRGCGDCGFADASDAEAKLREHGSADIRLIDAVKEAQKRKRKGLVILGDPGSGKTTHLKRLLLACLREGPVGLGLPPDMLPVFLPLRDLNDLTQGIDAFIEKTLTDPHLALPKGFGRQLLDRGRLLLLFDGLDEVSDPKHRAEVARWIGNAATFRRTCTVVVTCRFAGYAADARLGAEFLELHLRPLTREQSEAFITNWYRVVETGLAPDPKQGELTATQRAGDLIDRLRAPEYRSARMAEMTRNPLLLTNLCLVHRDRGVLPRGRHQLYEECIEVLLERWREAKQLAVVIPADLGKRVLQPAALWLHGEDGRTRASADELAPVIAATLQASQWRGGDATDFLRAVRDDSGLLTGWSSNQFGFMHLGFQEYLAACELRRLAFEGDKDAVLRELAGHYGQSWWQEVILLMLAQGNPSLFEPFIRLVLNSPHFAPGDGLFALILEESSDVSIQPFADWVKADSGRERAHRRMQWVALGMLAPRASEIERGEIEKLQSSLPVRVEEFSFSSSWTIDAFETQLSQRGNVELVKIPAGTFLMGSPESDQDASDDERPVHQVEIDSFMLGRYPVTNEEYGRFLADNPDAQEPAFWGDRQFNQARQPVVGVSWHEARRFVEWAGGRLPTEAEWEYAARAGTTTRYWWGDLFEKGRANCRGGQGLSPVGSFPPNPFGLHDTSGLVYEWCADWFGKYTERQQANPCGPAGGENRVLRGGSWNSRITSVRSAYRNGFAPEDRYDLFGFRLTLDSNFKQE